MASSDTKYTLSLHKIKYFFLNVDEPSDTNVSDLFVA